MSIKRFYASKDNTITNAFKPGLVSRAVSSNMGSSDILEVFSIYAQASTASLETSRTLIHFPISEIVSSRDAGTLPAAGSVKFRLKLYNAKHSETIPRNCSLTIHSVSTAWQEGQGLDMESYSDLGVCNWVSASADTPWLAPGGDFFDDASNREQVFTTGIEDLDVDVTDMVESWITTPADNHGFMIKLAGAYEDGSLETSHYTKRFFGKDSQYFFKRPIIEAQWESAQLNTGSLPDGYSQQDQYVFAVRNLKTEYKNYENAKISVYTRLKDWQPNIYTKASNRAAVDIVDEAYYKIVRVSDALEVIPYSHTKETAYSKMSYDSTGSYFELDMSLFEPGYLYEISFIRKNQQKVVEQEERFRFRVSE